MAVSDKLPKGRLKDRMSVCEQCEHKVLYVHPTSVFTVKRDICTQRNCKCSILGMALIPNQTCPEGKWKE